MNWPHRTHDARYLTGATSYIWGKFRRKEFNLHNNSLEGPIIALASDSPKQIVLKMGCSNCHQIPGIPWRTGTLGPILIEKTLAPKRLASAEYQANVRAGMAHANTPKDYVIESIVSPDNFIVPAFRYDANSIHSIMYRGYDKKFTYEALENIAKYLLSLDCDSAKKDGMNGPPLEPVSMICLKNTPSS